MKKIVLLCLMIALGGTVTNAQTKADRKAAKREKAEAAYAEIKDLIDSGSYHFTADWSNPLGSPRINLQLNINHLKIDGGQADILLPYFGVARSGGYGIDPGIVFNGEVSEYSMVHNDKKMRTTIKFTGRNKTEVFNFVLTVYNNGEASVNVNSSFRNSISYNGVLFPLEKVE
ncbi:DUF4251 domain-containing protein [Flavobacteriaceae bacterium 3-367]|uniref:DUF4251 domain-containing protein n=1 Tax=Eudoraea algarum TaxID=3417568 RepID=UPI003295B435